MWALGLAAISTATNGGSYDILGGSKKTEQSALANRDLLELWWGIKSREDLLRTLNWLETSGHRRQFDTLAALSPAQLAAYGKSDGAESENKRQIVLEHRDLFGPKSIAAWDFGRYVALCGWGYQAGYITEDEAWRKIMPIARLTQPLFHSWKDFGSDYMIGRRFWSLEQTNSSTGAYMEEMSQWLLESGKSPWTRIAWDLDLGSGEAKPVH